MVDSDHNEKYTVHNWTFLEYSSLKVYRLKCNCISLVNHGDIDW